MFSNETSLYIVAAIIIVFLVMWSVIGAFVYKRHGHAKRNGALLGLITGVLLLPVLIMLLLFLSLNSVYPTGNFSRQPF